MKGFCEYYNEQSRLNNNSDIHKQMYNHQLLTVDSVCSQVLFFFFYIRKPATNRPSHLGTTVMLTRSLTDNLTTLTDAASAPVPGTAPRCYTSHIGTLLP